MNNTQHEGFKNQFSLLAIYRTLTYNINYAHFVDMKHAFSVVDTWHTDPKNCFYGS